jgi:hypothetical protein
MLEAATRPAESEASGKDSSSSKAALDSAKVLCLSCVLVRE